MVVTRSVHKQASQILAEFKPQGILDTMTGPDTLIERIDQVERGDASSLVFVGDPSQVAVATQAAPAAIVTDATLAVEFAGMEGTAVLTGTNVKLAHALIREAYVDRDVRRTEWGQVHPSAVIHETVRLADGVIVGPGVVLGADVEVGCDTVIMANTVVETGARIGAKTVIHPNVVVGYECTIGDRVIIKSGCIIGMEGFGFAEDKEGKRYRIPQLGRVVIEDDVVLGANCNVDRATYDETRIGKGCKLDALCHIAHNVSMDENCVIVAQSGIAGSTHLGKRVILSGQTAIIDHVSIADDVALVHRAGVMSDIKEAGVYAGIPTQPMKDYFKNIAVAQRLVELRKKLQGLEKQVAELTSPDRHTD